MKCFICKTRRAVCRVNRTTVDRKGRREEEPSATFANLCEHCASYWGKGERTKL